MRAASTRFRISTRLSAAVSAPPRRNSAGGPESRRSRTAGDPKDKCALQKIIVALDDLPPGLDEKSRFSAWNDRFNAIKCRIDCSRIENPPFPAHFEATAVGTARTALCNATVNKMIRTRQTVAAEGVDEVVICINRGDTPMLTQQFGREAAVDPGAAVLMSMTEPGSVHANGFNYLMVGV